MSAERAVGVFGGCFDPIHNGHRAIAAAAASALPVARVLLVVNGQPAHRRAPVADYRQRLAMAGIVADSCLEAGSRVELSELEKPGSERYAIDTVAEIRRQGLWPVLIVGADAFASLPIWHRWEELLEDASFAVVARPAAVNQPVHERLAQMTVDDPSRLSAGPCIWHWRLAVADCASGCIRSQLAAGQSKAAGKCLDERVLAYIRKQGIYAAACQ